MSTNYDEPAYSGPACSDQKTARCARCSAIAPVNLYGGSNSGGTHYPDDRRAVFIASCSACGKGTVAIEFGLWQPIPNGSYGGRRWIRERTETWWPVGAETAPIDETVAVPEDALRFWHEANRCMSVQAYHSAAVMIRNVLTAIANDVGGEEVATERNLDGKLKKLTAAKPQAAFLLEYMEAIKAIGNAGAHPEDWPDVSEEHAERALMIARYLIEALYEQPQRIAANMMRRNAVR